MSADDLKSVRFINDPNLYPDVSHHRDAIESLFRIDAERTSQTLLEITRKKTVVFVCFSNRSGSNLLLDTLGRVGFGCEPGDEFFNAESITDHSKEFDFADFEQYLEYVITIRGFRDCVFLKIGPHQLFWLANSGLLQKYFAAAKYTLIERKDQIAQAVSLYVAEATGIYLRSREQAGQADPAQDIAYSKHGILKCLKHLTDVGALFRYFFELHSLKHHHIWYEQIDTDPVGTLKALIRDLSIEPYFPPHWERALQTQEAGIARQSSALNAQMIARFKQDFAIV